MNNLQVHWGSLEKHNNSYCLFSKTKLKEIITQGNILQLDLYRYLQTSENLKLGLIFIDFRNLIELSWKHRHCRFLLQWIEMCPFKGTSPWGSAHCFILSLPKVSDDDVPTLNASCWCAVLVKMDLSWTERTVTTLVFRS